MRKLKPHRIARVSCNDRHCEVMFDRDQLDFFATVGDSTVRAATAEEAKKKARDLLRAWKPPVWEQRMRVEVTTRDPCPWHKGGDTHLNLYFERFEVADRFDGSGKQRRVHFLDFAAGWGSDLSPEELRARHEASGTRQYDELYSDAGNPKGGDVVVELPYDDALWARLVELKAVIDRAGAELLALVARPDFAARLLAGSGLLLGPPAGRGEVEP